MFSSNVLLEGLDNGEGEGGAGGGEEVSSENLIVISFYLITRESGLLFQYLGNLVSVNERRSPPSVPSFIDTDSLKGIINHFFNCLINVKHLGSIDRIAQGLSQLCRIMNEGREPSLPQLADNLIARLMGSLETNSFKNFLRRSAGLPPAFTCLLKAEPAGKRKNLSLIVKKIFGWIEADDAE